MCERRECIVSSLRQSAGRSAYIRSHVRPPYNRSSKFELAAVELVVLSRRAGKTRRLPQHGLSLWEALGVVGE